MLSRRLLAVIAGSIAAAGTAEAGIVTTVFTTADGQIVDFPAGGSFESVSAANVNWTISRRSQPFPGVEDRAILEFDLASLTGATIHSATLRFLVSGTAGSPPGFQVHGFTGDGLVTTSDGSVSTTLMSPTLYSTVGARSLDVTSFVSGLVSASSQFAGFSFIQPSISDLSTGGGIASIASSLQPNPLNRPTLLIDYTPAAVDPTAPEPASLALMGLGGIGMLGGWYRKRRQALALAA